MTATIPPTNLAERVEKREVRGSHGLTTNQRREKTYHYASNRRKQNLSDNKNGEKDKEDKEEDSSTPIGSASIAALRAGCKRNKINKARDTTKIEEELGIASFTLSPIGFKKKFLSSISENANSDPETLNFDPALILYGRDVKKVSNRII